MVLTEERTVGLMSSSCARHREVLGPSTGWQRVSLSGEIDFPRAVAIADAREIARRRSFSATGAAQRAMKLRTLRGRN